MNLSALTTSPVGKLVTISGFDPRFREHYDYFAFVPEPLPEHLNLRPSTYSAVVSASAAVARADQAAALLPNPMLLARPAIRREAVSTSALEGTYAALTDVLEAEFMDRGQVSDAVGEVRNYVEAAENAYAWVQEGRPISRQLLESLQGQLVAGTPSDTHDAGHLRTTPVFIGAGKGRVSEARFVPSPPGDLLRDGMESWERWVRSDSEVPTVIRMAAAHYQFEALHPFNDGNGRIGRLVAVLQLLAAGDLSLPVLNLSPFFEANRREYQDGLLHVSETGAWDDWICFFSTAVNTQAIDAVSRVQQLLALKDGFQRQLREARAKGVSLRIADDLLGYPMITPTLASSMQGVSYPAANSAIARLVDLGILRQRSRGNYDRIFSCDQVLAVIER